jgi:nucleoside-diphosphate-sugar epimerase
MRVLVTGGSGNIGQDVTRLLADQGHAPVVYDLRPPPHAGTRFVQGDVRDVSSLERAFADVKPDGVIRLAGTLQFACEADPAGSASVNVTGTANALEAARKFDVRRFVFSSSVAVYGTTSATVDEASPIQADVTTYGASKLLAERMLRRYRALHGMACRTVRFSTVISSRPVTSPGVAAAVGALLSIGSGDDVVVEGIAETELRHFVHVSDAARGAILALLADDCESDLFNIAGGDDAYMRFSDLVSIVRRMRPGSGRARFVGTSGDRGRVDCRRAAVQLGYKPRFNMEMAIREALEACPMNA